MPPLQSFKGFQMHHVMEWLGTIIEFNCFLLFLGLPTSGFRSCQVFSTICIGLMMEWLHTVVLRLFSVLKVDMKNHIVFGD